MGTKRYFISYTYIETDNEYNSKIMYDNIIMKSSKIKSNKDLSDLEGVLKDYLLGYEDVVSNVKILYYRGV